MSADLPTVSSSCGRCGAPLKDGSSPCTRCGAVAGDGETIAPTTLIQTSDVPFAPGQRLGSRYTIIRMLGRGGMGVVYQAWDDELGTPVAIKTLLRPASADEDAERNLHERFKREILLARQVSHKNVVRIHDIGEVHGNKYITMAFIEGESLGALMRRVGRLPVPQALAIARQVVEGLAAAHEAGVIHRDLKPENVMITRTGDAIVMDFGIARLTEGSGSTGTGVVVGTIGYMAPEQALAKQTDARTDVYAFGLMLYDMLVGRQRIEATESAMAELLSRMQQAPKSPRELGVELPEATQALVMRCLEIEPAKRYASARELASAIADLTPDGFAKLVPTTIKPDTGSPPPAALPEWLVPASLAALVLFGTAAVAWRWAGSEAPALPPVERPPISIVIADFVNAANDPAFDGLVEQALAVGVESASFVTTYPRRDAVRAASSLPGGTLNDTNARLIAIREGINVVVTGRVDAAVPGYKLFVRAVNAGENERVLVEWSTDAKNKEDILPAVGRAAARLRSSLGDATANADHVRAEETFTASSLEAARAYVKGQELFAAGQFDQAVTAYREALALDSSFGRAWAGIGAVAFNQGRRADSESAYREAMARLDRMTERERLRTRGAYWVVSRNADKAVEENGQLVQKYPSDVAGLANLANGYFMRREFVQAREIGQKAAAIYPKNVLRQNNVGMFMLYAGDFAAAEKQAQHALSLNPQYVKAKLTIALTQVATDRFAEAERTYAELQELPGGLSFGALGLADLGMLRGRLASAVTTLEQAMTKERSPSSVTRLLLALADVRIAQGRQSDAVPLIARARTEAGDDDIIKFEAGRLSLLADRRADAVAIADQLASSLDKETQALGGLLKAQIAIAADNLAVATQHVEDARTRADSWLLRLTRARALIRAGRFAEADSELDACLRRRGEAAAVFLDDYPSYRYMAQQKYYAAVTRAGLNSPAAATAFREFLDLKNGGDETGGLVADARQRLAALAK